MDLYLPPKTVLSVRKYDPIGPTTIANVKPNNLYITCLDTTVSIHVTIPQTVVEAHAGTAGAILLFSPAACEKSLSSFSKMVFSPEIIRLVVMVLFLGGCGGV